MSEAAQSSEPADYGIDAPGVVRNLVVCGVVALAAGVSALAGVWSGHIVVPLGNEVLDVDVINAGTVVGLICLGMAGWMLWDSKVGKMRTRDWLLDQHSWTGAERVLDVGCGRGLLLIGAARRLTSGRAIGIDIWQSEDLSGNRSEATIENARREGVAERIELHTANMCEMPFPDDYFDVVTSRAAIHNLYVADERALAIGEIARVLKPGGVALIEDIRHQKEYAERFRAAGCSRVEQLGSPVMALVLFLLTFGSLRPGTLVVHKIA